MGSNYPALRGSAGNYSIRRSDCFLWFIRHIVGYPVDFFLEGTVISFNLTVGLGIEGRGSNMPDSHQTRVLIEFAARCSQRRYPTEAPFDPAPSDPSYR